MLNSAAILHIGESKTGKKSELWVTAPLPAKIYIYNRLHQAFHHNKVRQAV